MSGYRSALMNQQRATDNQTYYNLRNLLMRRNLREAKELIANGAQVNSPHGRACNTVLHFAITTGDFELVQLVLDKGALVNVQNINGKTPLHIAVELGYDVIVRILISKGADVNTTAKDLTTPIQAAISTRQSTISQLLICNGAQTNVKFNNGKTLFYNAVESGEESIVEFLLKQGSINKDDNKECLKLAIMSRNEKIESLLIEHNFQINPECINDCKFFHTIVAKGYVKIVNDLLSMGAKINSPVLQDTSDGFTLLHTACKFQKYNIIESLILYGMNLNIEDKQKKLAIYYAILNSDIEIIRLLLINRVCIKNYPHLLNISANKQKIGIVKLLLDYGADINGRDVFGRTPLYSSVFEQSSDAGSSLVKLLLARGAYVDAKTEFGETALHEAMRNNNEVAVNTLLEFNAEVNVSNSKGTTPLHLAIKAKNFDIVNSLLNLNADVKARDDDGLTALHFAAEVGELNIFKTLLKHNPDINAVDKSGSTPLHLAIKSKHINIVKILINSYAKINLLMNNGDNCLHIAADTGDLDIMKLLLIYCKDINRINKLGWTPLSIAARRNSDIVAYLLAYGASINITDVKGKNELIWAVQSDHLESVVSLLGRHADVNCKDSEGLTPLLIAIQSENIEIINTLLQHNADVNYTGYQDKSPLHFAVETGEVVIVLDLLAHGADVNYVNDEGLTAVLVEVNSDGMSEIMELLLQFGADTEFRTREGKTALYIATEKQRVDDVKILLSYGADMSALYNNRLALYEMYKFTDSNSSCDCGEIDCDNNHNRKYRRRDSSDDEDEQYVEFSSHVNECSDIVEAYKDHIRNMMAAHQHIDEKVLKAIKYFKKLEALKDNGPDDDTDYCNINSDDSDSESDADDESDPDEDENSTVEEVEKMKSEKIGTTNITFYNFLMSNVHRVARYVKNKNVVDVMKSGGYRSVFPTYAGMINARFYGGLQREKLLEKCDFFHHFVKLPFTCIDEIFNHLNNQDLRMMIDAYKSESGACKRKFNLIS